MEQSHAAVRSRPQSPSRPLLCHISFQATSSSAPSHKLTVPVMSFFGVGLAASRGRRTTGHHGRQPLSVGFIDAVAESFPHHDLCAAWPQRSRTKRLPPISIRGRCTSKTPSVAGTGPGGVAASIAEALETRKAGSRTPAKMVQGAPAVTTGVDHVGNGTPRLEFDIIPKRGSCVRRSSSGAGRCWLDRPPDRRKGHLIYEVLLRQRWALSG